MTLARILLAAIATIAIYHIAQANAERTIKQEIINDCQQQGYFKYRILTFSCKQLFVAE